VQLQLGRRDPFLHMKPLLHAPKKYWGHCISREECHQDVRLQNRRHPSSKLQVAVTQKNRSYVRYNAKKESTKTMLEASAHTTSSTTDMLASISAASLITDGSSSSASSLSSFYKKGL